MPEARIIVSEAKLFADFLPRQDGQARRLCPAGMVVRPAMPEDVDGLARLICEREGRDFADEQARRSTELRSYPAADRLLLVAMVNGDLVAFGRAKFIKSVQFAPGESTGPVPEGWYLMGMIVDPAWRRRGIGEEITRCRLKWIAQFATEAFYFVNSLNRASIELHRNLGFELVQSNFHFPGAHFSGGGGGLLFKTCMLSAI